MTKLPVSGNFEVTAEYKEVNTKYWATYHKGIDFVSDNKTVYSPCEGVVRVIAYDKTGWGWYVSIGDNQGLHHILCHLATDTICVEVGDIVTPTTKIGIMGNTGNVTGVHVHYQINKDNKDIDPYEYLGYDFKRGKYNSKDFQIGGEEMIPTDFNEAHDYAKKYISLLYEYGITDGYEDGTFKPRQNITREECAAMIGRLIEAIQIGGITNG